MTNRIIIDGQDAYTSYGLYLKSYAPLLAWPSYKTVDTNEWHEENAVEADLSSPALDSRQFSLVFFLSHPDNAMMAQSLLSKLTEDVYHTLAFPQLGKTYSGVRYVSNSSFDTNERFDTITITFAQDTYPLPNTAPPQSYSAPQLGYTIDDCDFGLFGCTVTKGTRASMWKYAGAKENQKYSSKYTSGISYDSEDGVHLSSRDITVNLHMHSALSSFWTNWDALWTLVFKTDSTKGTAAAVRVVEGDGMEFQCYYKSNRVSRFILTESGDVWCDFSITFTVLAYNRGEDWFYLATQDSEQVTTEDQNVEDNPVYVRIGIPPSLLSSLGPNLEQQTAVKISQLPSAGSSLGATAGLLTIGVDNTNQSVSVPLGSIMTALIDRVSLAYNIDNEHPLPDGGCYTLSTALPVIAADTTISASVKSGMVLVFYDGNVWRVWQYQKRYTEEEASEFVDADNWRELAVSTNLASKADKSYVDERLSQIYTKQQEDAVHGQLQQAIQQAAEQGGVKRMTQAQYDALQSKSLTTIYAVTNASDALRKLYLGTVLIAKADASHNNAFTYTFPIVFHS